MNRILEYFDLGSKLRPIRAQATAAGEKPRTIHLIPQYLALISGIVLQPFFQKYMSTGTWDFTGILGWLIASVVISLMAFPAVYKHALDPEQPIFVQFCVIFTSGTGWQTIVTSALKAAGVVAGGNPHA
ncbi:MAG TPA: hypothetical protein VMJ32_11750 [Pirellulales bacterium]|nr:hypothetical protein [Pirellulales bacterium]